MKAIIGLGNPGKKYDNTPHNIGFAIVDHLQSMEGFSPWENNKNTSSLISQGETNGEKVLLAKPQTFMNNSGITTQQLIHYFHLKTDDIIIIHDDADLPFGTIRVSQDRGSAGHKGIESIIQNIGGKNFIRIRIGIHPTKEKTIKAEAFVLKKFRADQKELVTTIAQQTKEAIIILFQKGIQAAMTAFN